LRFRWEPAAFSGNFGSAAASPGISMSDAGFDSSLILEAFRFETRLDRLDGEDVWFQPNGISWQWTQPAWSMPAAGRTPRAGLAPLAFPDGDLWGLRLLAM